jgi:orotate phosphoribosyltransferase
VHVHAYDADGAESLAAEPCAAALRAVRARCPCVPVSLTTSADIEGDPRRRLELVAGWTELPDLVTANQGEDGIVELCEHLIGRGVGIEAGLLELADAHAFVRSGLADRCVRVLMEPLDADPRDAAAHAAAMEEVVTAAGIALEQVHHGDGIASWAVNQRALDRGHGIRTGLEDTTVLPDGRLAPDNAALVRTAAVLMAVGASRGHFAYESGHHGDLWLDLDSLFVDPARTDRFAAALAERLEPLALDAVCGPLVGGALLAQAVGAHLGVDLLYAERHDGPRYRLPDTVRAHAAGRTFAIVDDVVNAGSATRATYAELVDAGARPVAVAALLTLGTALPAFARERGLELESLAALPNALWEPDDCPLCAAGVPLG